MTAATNATDGTDDRAVEGPGLSAAAAGSAARPRSVPQLCHLLGTAARRGAVGAGLDATDVEMIVDLTAVAAARSARAGSPTDTLAVAEQMGATVAAVAARGRQVWPDHVGAADWAPFGAVIPVLAGSPAAGASTVAAAITDIIHQDKRCCLLIDADDPARSGLAQAAGADGPWTRPVTDQVQVRYSWRGGRPGAGALLARLDTTMPGVTPGMVPAPPDWLPDPPPRPLHVTVADLGNGGWRAAAAVTSGAGGWLRGGELMPRPVLVVRATRPSLRAAEQVLARHDTWVQAGVAAPVCALVVNGAKRWPVGIDGATGPRLSTLLDGAVFIPPNAAVEADGVTPDPLPDKVTDALRPLLASWGVIDLLAGSAAARDTPGPGRGPGP
ncbi:hypothetical protein [Pseudonocardia sp. ICBG601]|uniref:hypothetical protein n=1 Tax=Pseudonocardia sp. ICBG601 TaxID=2846759 RepID=UPI001CF6520B|nr:hypothetical protein [Pseudonocardia sp. ICBG601]